MISEVNVTSDFFPAESYMIDNIITSTPCFATLERATWYQLLYSQDDTRIWLSTIDASLYPVSYTQAISNVVYETDFARSRGLAHELLNKTDSDQLFLWNLLPHYLFILLLMEDKQVSRYPTCPKYVELI